MRIKDGPACLDVKLPPVPGATNDLTLPFQHVFTHLRVNPFSNNSALAKRRQLMRTGVPDREELAANVENTDRPIAHRNDSPFARREFLFAADDVSLSHR